ncbi:MAG: LbtU family siderophore porin [Gammaproteobacteria bacterium]|nr:LbtU family siderophore porin [Gammaproteobacteria bacterium]
MKLKLVVASMSAACLLSTAAFAADAPVKHKHHHAKKHHHHMMAATAYKGDYKGVMPVVVETCPPTTQFANVLDTMDQNIGRARPTEDCNKLISFAGGLNFDAHWGNRNINYQGRNNQRLSLNDAYLNIFGNVNEWTKAFMSISYGDPSDKDDGYVKPNGEYSNVYTANGENKLTLEQGFIRISNFDVYPVYLQLGKQYSDFGRYTIHPITRSMTQVLSETLRTSAVLGFVVPMGFHGDIYAFDNPIREANSADVAVGHPHTNYGAAIGYDAPGDQLGWGVNVAYMYNMVGVNDVATVYTGTGIASAVNAYKNRVSAIALDGTINSGPFSLIGDYVTALQRFFVSEIPARLGSTSGAKPWAGNLQAGYGFMAWSRNQNIYVGYQTSGDSVYFNLPKSRWLIGWNADVWKNTNMGLEVGHDTDYNQTDGGTGRTANTVAFRAAVKFG